MRPFSSDFLKHQVQFFWSRRKDQVVSHRQIAASKVTFMQQKMAVLLCVFQMILGAPSAFAASEKPPLPSEQMAPEVEIYLDDALECQTRINQFIEEYPEWNEKHKINFLINSVRTSGNAFIRNGSTYESTDAAKWLRWKMHHRQFRDNPITTAEDFVLRVASKSNNSGHPYKIVLRDGSVKPLGEVLKAELKRLDEKLLDHTLASAMNEESMQNQHVKESTLTPNVVLSTAAPTN